MIQDMLPLINQFVYRPDATFAPANFTPTSLGLAYEDVWVETADGLKINGWFLPAEAASGMVLYCHGNAGDVRDWVHAAPPFLSAGQSLLIWDYRGYGRSQGQPSEQGLYRDGVAVWTWLANRAKQDGLRPAILGKSLGSAVAVYLAAQEQGDGYERPPALILDSAFTSMREVVARHAAWLPAGAVPRLFESLELAPGIDCPTLVIHGGRDSLVPVEQAKRLYSAIGGEKVLRIVAGAEHNDLSIWPEYNAWLMDFLADPEGFCRKNNN